jgi:hypothetical protein
MTHLEDIRLEVAENGFILSYCERIDGKGLANCSYDYKKEVYTEENIMEAIAKMKALTLAGKVIEKSESE